MSRMRAIGLSVHPRRIGDAGGRRRRNGQAQERKRERHHAGGHGRNHPPHSNPPRWSNGARLHGWRNEDTGVICVIRSAGRRRAHYPATMAAMAMTAIHPTTISATIAPTVIPVFSLNVVRLFMQLDQDRSGERKSKTDRTVNDPVYSAACQACLRPRRGRLPRKLVAARGRRFPGRHQRARRFDRPVGARHPRGKALLAPLPRAQRRLRRQVVIHLVPSLEGSVTGYADSGVYLG